MLHSVAGVGRLYRVTGDSAWVTRPPDHHPAIRVIVVSHGGAQSRRELPVLLIIVPTPAPGCGGIVTILATSLDWSHTQSIDTLNALNCYSQLMGSGFNQSKPLSHLAYQAAGYSAGQGCV